MAESADLLPDSSWLLKCFPESFKHKTKFHEKWVIVADLSRLASLWKSARELHQNKKLDGIKYMKIANIIGKFAVIYFYCGTSEDVSLIMKFGKNLVDKLEYTNSSGYILFKTDTTTGNDEEVNYNYTYRIDVPVATDDCDWTMERNPRYVQKYGICNGKWTMFFKCFKIQRMWQLACNLYQEGVLDGVSYMQCSKNEDCAGLESTGAIRFYCGSLRDESATLNYGKNIVKKMKYSDPTWYMTYSADLQTSEGHESFERREDDPFRISVPVAYNDQNWNVEQNVAYFKKYGASDGKWILHYTFDEIQKYWKLAVELFRNHELEGITYMKCSKRKKGVSSDSFGEMEFYCGPSNDKESMIQFAKVLVDKLSYYNSSGYITYSMDCSETEFQYKIPEPVDSSNREWFVESNVDSECRWDGKWIMQFNYSDIEQKWELACEYLQNGKLDGVSHIKCSKRHEDEAMDSTGFILFYCGPSKNKNSMIQCAEILVEKLEYTNQSGYITYSIDGKGKTTSETKGSYRFKIPDYYPSSDDNWIILKSPKYVQKYVKSDGEWIMHFPVADIQKKWDLACEFFRKGELKGISCLKCSKTENASLDPMGAITFRCAPSINKDLIITYGEILVDKMQYTDELGDMNFKMDLQTNEEDWSAEDLNYSIPVPFSPSDCGWICEQSAEYVKKYGQPDGKWTLRFERDDIEKNWESALELFRNGKLEGMSCMQRQLKKTNATSAVILFCCGPSSNRKLMLHYAEILVDRLKYNNGNIMYTKNIQAGDTSNRRSSYYTYRIPSNNEQKIRFEDIPLRDWIVEQNPEYVRKYGRYDGKWIMSYNYSGIERIWEQACELFRKGELDGISCMRCLKNVKGCSDFPRKILFFCGPSHDKKLIMQYGQNLLDKIKYQSDEGFMYFKKMFKDIQFERYYSFTYRIEVEMCRNSKKKHRDMSPDE